jgi:N-acetylneuraminate lyase
MDKLHLQGLVAAAHTPFHADGSLNLTAVEAQAGHFLKNGLTWVFIGGSTGESHSLTAGERRDLAERWIDVARGTALRVIVHVGSNCLTDARELAAHAQARGAKAVAALCPSYFKPADVSMLVDCCAEIASGAPDLPFYFYDIPVLTGVHLPMNEFLLQGSRRIPNLAGIKWTNADLYAYQRCSGLPGDFDLPWGIDEALLAALALGARGAVGSSYCFAAPVYHRLIAAFEAGDMPAAREEQSRSVELVRILASFGYMGAAKALMKMLGVDVGPARLPNGNPSAEQVGELRRQLDEAGFWEWIAG